MKVASFLPDIVKRFHRKPPWCEWLSGTVLFADVSGFTPLSEALSVSGAAGSEMLSDTLNRYFSEMVSIVHSCGGDVMKFGGDSILCLFADQADSQNAMIAAFKMQQASSGFRSVKTPSAKFKLQMKIGIAYGEVFLGAIGDPAVRCDYVFAGEAVA
ncbi:MAG TPA: adenylate/guanylate cyclase domain-containing protein, partial [Acidobacteriota bacterium]